jgi:FMN-dependent NADH-azoreductase
MHILNIVTSPRKDQSASRALVDAFLHEYMTQHAGDIVVDTLDVWEEWLPEFDAQTINAKYKGVSGEPMTPAEAAAWEKIRELASRFQRADRIVMGVPMWNFSFPLHTEATDRPELSAQYVVYVRREALRPVARHREGICRIRSRAKRRGWI